VITGVRRTSTSESSVISQRFFECSAPPALARGPFELRFTTLAQISSYATPWLVHQTAMRIVPFDKCCYICKVVVVNPLYITFLIHKNSLHSKFMQ